MANPYAETGALITRDRDAFGIWWWNAEWVRERLGALAGRVRILPETVARAPGVGWRCVQASTGFEAQLWRDGFLVGDVWSRRPFEQQDWEFVVHAFGSPDDSPESPPPSVAAPYDLASPYLKSQVSELSVERLLPSLVAGFVVLTLCLSGFWIGEGLRLGAETDKLNQQVSRMRTVSSAERQHLLKELSQLQALQTATARPDPLAVLLDAENKLKPFGVQVQSFSATGDTLTLALPNEAGAGLDLISDQLQASGEFYDFKPKRDAAKQQVTLVMRVRPR